MFAWATATEQIQRQRDTLLQHIHIISGTEWMVDSTGEMLSVFCLQMQAIVRMGESKIAA